MKYASLFEPFIFLEHTCTFIHDTIFWKNAISSILRNISANQCKTAIFPGRKTNFPYKEPSNNCISLELQVELISVTQPTFKKRYTNLLFPFRTSSIFQVSSSFVSYYLSLSLSLSLSLFSSYLQVFSYVMVIEDHINETYLNSYIRISNIVKSYVTNHLCRILNEWEDMRKPGNPTFI